MALQKSLVLSVRKVFDEKLDQRDSASGDGKKGLDNAKDDELQLCDRRCRVFELQLCKRAVAEYLKSSQELAAFWARGRMT